MTSTQLLIWIVGAILLQLAIYLAISFWGRWNEYLRIPEKIGNQPDKYAPERPDNQIGSPSGGWSGFRKFRVERKEIEDTYSTICSFYLKPVDDQPLPTFYPGQFLTFGLELQSANGQVEPVVRCYSLSDAPGKEYYRVSIKRVPAPKDSQVPAGRSSNYFHDQVKVGDILNVRAPSGHFYIERSDDPVVFVGGGIGITPMLSMLNWVLEHQPEREVWLFYGVRNKQELMMKSQLESLSAKHSNFHLHLCFSDPSPADVIGQDFHHLGRINVNLMRMHLPLKPYHFYICGPTSMMESLVHGLEDWGVAESHIHFEAFGPASIKRRSSKPSISTESGDSVDIGISVKFSLSGKQLHWRPSDGTLLEFAEANAVAVNSGCRAGGCGTCQTRLLEGEVVYNHSPDFDVEPGACLLCLCAPKTSVILEA